MKIHVITKNDEIHDLLRTYAVNRIEEIEHFGQEFEKAEIILDQQRHLTRCEVVLHPRRGPAFVAHQECEDGRAAVDGAASKLERQILKAKDKHSPQARRRQANDQS